MDVWDEISLIRCRIDELMETVNDIKSTIDLVDGLLKTPRRVLNIIEIENTSEMDELGIVLHKYGEAMDSDPELPKKLDELLDKMHQNV
jgi:hypothetical protein